MYKHYLTILSSRVEVFPLNFNSTSLIDEKEKDQIFYRRKFNGTLRFKGDDFELLYVAELTSPCEYIIYEIEKKVSGTCNTYEIYWAGQFSTTDGAFDLDRCTFDVTPSLVDDYMNFILNGDIEYNILDIPTIVTTNTHAQTYDRNRWLIDVIEFIVTQIEPASSVVSWFFNNLTNYVIGGVNKYQYITIAQKSDIKRPNSSNPATLAMLSFNELLNILKMYNVYYKYEDGIFRLEHISYWDNEAGMDLRTQKLAEKSNKYSYLKDDMPRFEKFSFMEAGDVNYVEHIISYDHPCVNNENNTFEYGNRITTDLQYIVDSMANPDFLGSNIDESGFVILANLLEGMDYWVCYGTAYASVMASYNYVNSWSFLLRAFFRHDRVLMNGFIQGIPIDFMSARKTKLQEIKAIVCASDNYNPDQYITTELGENWFAGQKGYVNRADLKPNGQVDFRLVYGEDENGEAVMPEQIKTIRCVIETPFSDVRTFLSEPNIYDSYYWVYFNDDDINPEACMEIMIPAGVTYQEDMITYHLPIVSVKFNPTSSSIAGWLFVYNNNEPVDYADPGDCGDDPAPPAVPPIPAMTGAGQGSVCDKVTINWAVSAGATFYSVYRKPDDDLVDNWMHIDNSINNYYEDFWAGTQGGITFYYKVKACNISGCSDFSDEASINIVC